MCSPPQRQRKWRRDQMTREFRFGKTECWSELEWILSGKGSRGNYNPNVPWDGWQIRSELMYLREALSGLGLERPGQWARGRTGYDTGTDWKTDTGWACLQADLPAPQKRTKGKHLQKLNSRLRRRGRHRDENRTIKWGMVGSPVSLPCRTPGILLIKYSHSRGQGRKGVFSGETEPPQGEKEKSSQHTDIYWFPQ